METPLALSYCRTVLTYTATFLVLLKNIFDGSAEDFQVWLGRSEVFRKAWFLQLYYTTSSIAAAERQNDKK